MRIGFPRTGKWKTLKGKKRLKDPLRRQTIPQGLNKRGRNPGGAEGGGNSLKNLRLLDRKTAGFLGVSGGPPKKTPVGGERVDQRGGQVPKPMWPPRSSGKKL